MGRRCHIPSPAASAGCPHRALARVTLPDRALARVTPQDRALARVTPQDSGLWPPWSRGGLGGRRRSDAARLAMLGFVVGIRSEPRCVDVGLSFLLSVVVALSVVRPAVEIILPICSFSVSSFVPIDLCCTCIVSRPVPCSARSGPRFLLVDPRRPAVHRADASPQAPGVPARSRRRGSRDRARQGVVNCLLDKQLNGTTNRATGVRSARSATLDSPGSRGEPPGLTRDDRSPGPAPGRWRGSNGLAEPFGRGHPVSPQP
jgi:hypothetical protein